MGGVVELARVWRGCAFLLGCTACSLTACGSSRSGAASGGPPSVSAASGVPPSSADGGALDCPQSGSQPTHGCGLGTCCIPGADLPPPADGFQIVTPPGTFAVQPGQEAFPFYCADLPDAAEFDVGEIQSWMTPGSSHELFVYHGVPTGQRGTGACSSNDARTWLFASSIAGQIVELKMPDGVGVPLPSGTQIVLSPHFVNFGTAVEYPQIKLNLVRTRTLRQAAAAMVSFNAQIDVPSATASGPGTQTVSGTCTAPPGSSFFAIGTHTYAHATTADVDLVSGGTQETIVHTTDWQNPDVGVWLSPPYLSLQAGDSIAYRCAYSNGGASQILVGDSQATNEMCMTVGYYFPAGSTSCN